MSKISRTLLRIERGEGERDGAWFLFDDNVGLQFGTVAEAREYVRSGLQEAARMLLLAFALAREPNLDNPTVGEWRTCVIDPASVEPVKILGR